MATPFRVGVEDGVGDGDDTAAVGQRAAEGRAVVLADSGGIAAMTTYGGARLTITSSLIEGNASDLLGAGGVSLLGYEYGGASAILTGDRILDNRDTQPDSAGGVSGLSDEYSNITVELRGCLVEGNTATAPMSTGGIGGLEGQYGSVVVDVSSTKILDNTAPDDGYGGGVAAWQLNPAGPGHASLQLTGDMIADNRAGSSPSGHEGIGGGVFVVYDTYLTIAGTTIEDNDALGTAADGGEGGGIFDYTYIGATITGSTIEGNHATGSASSGGGIYALPEYGPLAVSTSTIASNSAVAGGGVFLGDDGYQASFDRTTISDNDAGSAGAAGAGGGVFDVGSVDSFTNSTISANRAFSHGATKGEGGGIYNAAESTSLYYTTLAGNAAQVGGGLYEGEGTSDSYATLRDSILVANTTAPGAHAASNCFSVDPVDVATSLGGNVLSSGACVVTPAAGDVVSANPRLGPLAQNGGPTKTMALLASSPAIDAAHGDCVTTDQRGVPRPTTGRCDSGAYQHVVARHHSV